MLDLVERFRTSWVYAVPTVMSRIAKLPEHELARRDLSSIRTLVHMAAPCAPWLKLWWIDRLGADAVWEVYAGTEAQTITLIGGSDWLAHPGSVGRPLIGELRILDSDGQDLPPGQVGEVYMRPSGGVETYRYLGGTPKTRDGWESLGDLGHLDEQGYLYLADRLSDMVLVGGVNVYPAEVEAALESHLDVLSSCVVGLPDDDLGNRLHAVVQTSRDVPDEALHTLLAERPGSAQAAPDDRARRLPPARRGREDPSFVDPGRPARGSRLTARPRRRGQSDPCGFVLRDEGRRAGSA